MKSLEEMRAWLKKVRGEQFYWSNKDLKILDAIICYFGQLEKRINKIFCQMAREEYFGIGFGDLFLHLNYFQYIELLKKLGIILGNPAPGKKEEKE
jgi:hypothetical protein